MNATVGAILSDFSQKNGLCPLGVNSQRTQAIFFCQKTLKTAISAKFIQENNKNIFFRI